MAFGCDLFMSTAALFVQELVQGLDRERSACIIAAEATEGRRQSVAANLL